jgi:hypothetical protein
MSNISVFDTRITFDLAIDANTATGDRLLSVTTPYGASTSPLKFSILDPSSPAHFLTNLTIASNTISFNLASPGARMTAGSLLNYSAAEIETTRNQGTSCRFLHVECCDAPRTNVGKYQIHVCTSPGE